MLLDLVQRFREDVLSSTDASLILPAGCGKTEILAALATSCGTSGQRVLVLTHTNAGVDAVRRRLRKFSISGTGNNVRVQTIDGLLQRIGFAFPSLGEAVTVGEHESSYWNAMRTTAVAIAESSNVRRILQRSWDLLIVDEYQDCDRVQHDFVCNLAGGMRTVVLGDPMQAIFGFDGELIDWDADVVPRFPPHEGFFDLDPWRWRGKNEALGDWLLNYLRPRLATGQPIDLRNSPVERVPASEFNRRTAHYDFIHGEASTVFILPTSFRVIPFAKTRQGHFPAMENQQLTEALRLARDLDDAADARAVAIATFEAIDSTTAGVSSLLGFKKDNIRDRLANGTGLPSGGQGSRLLLRTLLNRTMNTGAASDVAETLAAVLNMPELSVFARQRLEDVLEATLLVCGGECDALVDGIAIVRARRRGKGGAVPDQCSAHTLLIKGLEFDRCVVVDADDLSTKNLYVAMTRGSRQLRVLSNSPILNPDR